MPWNTDCSQSVRPHTARGRWSVRFFGTRPTLVLKSRHFDPVVQRWFAIRTSRRRRRASVLGRQPKRIIRHRLGHQLRRFRARRRRRERSFSHCLGRHHNRLALDQRRYAWKNRIRRAGSHRDPLTLRHRSHGDRLARLARRRRTLLAAPIAKEAAAGRRKRAGRQEKYERLLRQTWTSKVHDITACRSPTS